MSAAFSPCRTWRYALTREVFTLVPERTLIDLSKPEGEVGRARMQGRVERGGRGAVAFVGLNPSTADEVEDDPTVRRCVGFARRWGFDRMVLLNLFAFRSTDPRALRDQFDPVGPDNDGWIERAALEADLVVAAWGNHGALLDRGEKVRDDLRLLGPLHALGLNATGQPKHPLYLPAALDPVPWW